MESNANPSLHLWFPDIFEFKGGIQVYSNFFLEALQNLYPDFRYEVFLKHDRGLPAHFQPMANTKFNFAGNCPKSLRTQLFASQIFGHAIWKRPKLIISSHANFTIVAYLLKRLAGIPYWAIVHGIEVWNQTNPRLKIALQNADRILAVSNYTRDRLLNEQSLDQAKISLLPNNFDANRFKITAKPKHLLERYNLDLHQPIILTVARLSHTESYKGYDNIILALPKIRYYIPNIHYIIVGKGDDLPRINQLVQSLDLQSHITLTGFVDDEQMCDHYNLCDVFAMPSKGEGFGIVYLEALACGKPVLGGNQDGAVDALCHGRLGALVNPNDLEEIAKTLIEIIQGNYPNHLMYQPKALRQNLINTFGFERFKETLAGYMSEHCQSTIRS